MEQDTATLEPDALADLRGFNPTNAQDGLLDRYLERTGKTFARVMDEALREYFEAKGYEWPTKYGARRAKSA